MTQSVGVHEAKTHLSKLLERVAAGEEITITRRGEAVARLVSVAPAPKRVFGEDEGKFEVPEDFDDPLPDDLLELFYK
jgi:prevent-host-death family protein